MSGFFCSAFLGGFPLSLHVPEVCSFHSFAASPCVSKPQLVHSPVGGHLGWFPFLTVMNKAAMNILILHRVFVKIK